MSWISAIPNPSVVPVNRPGEGRKDDCYLYIDDVSTGDGTPYQMATSRADHVRRQWTMRGYQKARLAGSVTFACPQLGSYTAPGYTSPIAFDIEGRCTPYPALPRGLAGFAYLYDGVDQVIRWNDPSIPEPNTGATIRGISPTALTTPDFAAAAWILPIPYSGTGFEDIYVATVPTYSSTPFAVGSVDLFARITWELWGHSGTAKYAGIYPSVFVANVTARLILSRPLAADEIMTSGDVVPASSTDVLNQQAEYGNLQSATQQILSTSWNGTTDPTTGTVIFAELVLGTVVGPTQSVIQLRSPDVVATPYYYTANDGSNFEPVNQAHSISFTLTLTERLSFAPPANL